MKPPLTIDQLADIQAIRQRLAQHSRGVDRADEALLADCYHHDATVDYGFFEGSARVFAGILAGAQLTQSVTSHRTAQMWIMLEGEAARSESYIIAYASSPDEQGVMHQRLICGRYLDLHSRRNGDWRLASRTYVIDTNFNWPGAFAGGPLAPLAGHVPQGGQGRADPGQGLLAQANARNTLSAEGEPPMPSTPIDPAAVDEIISRQQIVDLTMAYCRGVDRIDEVLLGSLFHVDSVVVTGAYNGIGSGFAAAICDVLRSHFAMTFHSIANQWIQVTGDRAVGETYVIAAATGLDGATEKLIGGRYIDRFERRDRVWKFSERSFVEDWDRTNPATSSTSGMYATLDLRGGRGSDDPVHAFWEQG